MKPGEVALVGAGPGDPGLITRAGAEALAQADVVVYDNLADARLLQLAPPGTETIHAGKAKGKCVLSQEEINRLLVEKAREGRRVVRLKGGDPFIFGRGAEEAEHLLAAGVPFRVVPGVTAAIGVSAYAGIPLTHRGITSSVAFVTGHHDLDAVDPLTGRARVDWRNLAGFSGTIVVYMGLSRLGAIAKVLVDGGKSPLTPAAVVASGTLSRQRTVVGHLSDVAERATAESLTSPALLVVGDVVRRRSDLAWFEAGPLFGRRIVVTRPEGEAAASARVLEELGAEALAAPLVRILPPEDYAPLDAAVERMATYDWVVFTSANGVEQLLRRVFALGRDVRVFGRAKFAAIGPATAEALARFHLRADLVPDSHRSEGLASALRQAAAGARVLLARADRGRTVIQEELADAAHVDMVTVYRNVDVDSLTPETARRIEEGSVDWITLTSSAAAARLHGLLSPSARSSVGSQIRLATISPVTTAAANALGWAVAAEAEDHDWKGLVAALVDAESSR